MTDESFFVVRSFLHLNGIEFFAQGLLFGLKVLDESLVIGVLLLTVLLELSKFFIQVLLTHEMSLNQNFTQLVNGRSDRLTFGDGDA